MGPVMGTFFAESRSLVLSECCGLRHPGKSQVVVLVQALRAGKAKSHPG